MLFTEKARQIVTTAVLALCLFSCLRRIWRLQSEITMGRSFVPCKVMVQEFGEVRAEIQSGKVKKFHSREEGSKQTFGGGSQCKNALLHGKTSYFQKSLNLFMKIYQKALKLKGEEKILEALKIISRTIRVENKLHLSNRIILECLPECKYIFKLNLRSQTSSHFLVNVKMSLNPASIASLTPQSFCDLLITLASSHEFGIQYLMSRSYEQLHFI